MTALNLDRMSYLVIRDHRDGPLLPERMLADTDRATTIQDIATGQFGVVLQVLECNPAERICCDVTEDVMAAAYALRGHPEEPRRRATQEQIWDHERDTRKHEAA